MTIFFKRSLACFFFIQPHSLSVWPFKNEKVLTSAVASHWLRRQQMPALRRKDTGNPKCTRFHRCDQTASPKCNKEEDIGEDTHTGSLTDPSTSSAHIVHARGVTVPGGRPAQFESSLPILA